MEIDEGEAGLFHHRLVLDIMSGDIGTVDEAVFGVAQIGGGGEGDKKKR